MYFQEYIPGIPAAALYVASSEETRLVGLTKQLVGETWLHARPFQYCGSIGPLDPSPSLRAELEEIGKVLTQGCQLRGLFGIDGVLAAERFWPVEVNPRYTASVEVLERATGWLALGEHAAAFSQASGWCQPPGLASGGCQPPVDGGSREKFSIVTGKSILFARQNLLYRPVTLPDVADIPHAGDFIPAGRPILSLFVHAATVEECLALLQQKAEALERELFP